MTVRPTMQPTFSTTTNITTSTPITNKSIGADIGVGVIIGITIASLAGIAAIFNKLICFRVFDYLGAERGLLQDICSCYKKNWNEARTPVPTNENDIEKAQQNQEEHNQDEKEYKQDKNIDKQGQTTSYQQLNFDDLGSQVIGEGGAEIVRASTQIIPPLNMAEVELNRVTVHYDNMPSASSASVASDNITSIMGGAVITVEDSIA